MKALAFTTLPFAVFSRERRNNPWVGAIHELPQRIWRDPLVGSDEHRLMTHAASPGTTSVPLRRRRRDPLVGSVFRKDLLVRSVIDSSGPMNTD
ncbi:hypothetical protein THTE_4449 [Thermogutta terrifontis]|uniref:Uncharacterized protein n=1 Tax=Thermogutta terrifontis TaxID=1331910 RepID=A0A286RM73_9BACT|nr:hypothetical protein THTE_4449 [Thermogutta terrifontis]